jgi:hypothetical protein
VADRVVLQHELAGERSVRIEGHRRCPVERRVVERPDGGRRAALLRWSSSSAASRVTPSFSRACSALILCTSSQLNPAIGRPPATVCATSISIGYMYATWWTTTPIFRPSPGCGSATPHR